MQTRPCHFGVGEILVGLDLALLHPVLGVDDDPQPLADAEPEAVRMAQAGRNALVQNRRRDRLQDAGLLGAPEPAGIDRDQEIGGAVPALGLDPLDQLIGVALDPVDLDAGLLGELVVERWSVS